MTPIGIPFCVNPPISTVLPPTTPLTWDDARREQGHPLREYRLGALCRLELRVFGCAAATFADQPDIGVRRRTSRPSGTESLVTDGSPIPVLCHAARVTQDMRLV